MDTIANDSNLSGEMMETCKSDTSMMSSMCKNTMENPEMIQMMHKYMRGKMDMKGMKGMKSMKGMNNMEGMNHKTK